MKYFVVLFLVLVLASCNYKRVEKMQFVGKWQYADKSVYKGVVLNFTCLNDTLTGAIDAIPADNKILTQYVPSGKKWLTGVVRKSNFLFEAKEAKPDIDVLKFAGLPSLTTYKMVLINDTTIALAETGDPYKSKNILKKIN